MIAPGVRVVDVEPDGFGVLCALLAGAQMSGHGELHLLHDAGHVLRAVHTQTGATSDYHEPIVDPPGRARELRALTGVDRVVIVDRSGLSALAPALAAAGPAEVDQPEMIRRSTAAFWSSPAVATDPAPPDTAGWEALSRHLRTLGDDYWGLLAGYDGDVCAFTALARFVHGRMALLTSLLPVLGSSRPPASEAAALLAAAQTRGSVPLVLVADLDVLRSVAAAPDVPAALSACAPRALLTRGLPA